MPIQRRLPKKGFTNIFAKDYTVVNVERLAGLAAGTKVDAASLKASGVISRIGKDGLKVLGRGDLAVALDITAAKWTKSAEEKVTAAGGSISGSSD
jgi:large subunit ribosomal protein L15